MNSVTRELQHGEENYLNIFYNVMFRLLGMKRFPLIKEKIILNGEDFNFKCGI